MSVLWAYRCYVSARGVDEIRAWYDGQPPKVRAKFLSRLKILAGMPAHEWKMPLFRWLHGECKGLGEIRFAVGNTQHRPLGFQRPPKNVFTLSLCAVERDDAFVPKDACGIALRRKNEIETIEERSHALWLVLE